MNIEQIPAESILFFMLYGGVAFTALIACIYLCVRKGNAFAAGITPPVSLRRWAASFFALTFLLHVWWFLFGIYPSNLNSVEYLIIASLDCIGLLITIAGTLLSMLQDRKRSVWPIVAATILFVVLLAVSVAFSNDYLIEIASSYILLVFVSFCIYMIFALKKYGRWLRDNYADLEHKEVWQSQVLVIIFLIAIISYRFDSGNIVISYIVQLICLPLFGLLLWRVETLQQLVENTPMEQACSSPSPETAKEPERTLNIPPNIEQLLDDYCVSTQLYLQHDLTLHQLARAVGTNRFYLSPYFSRQGITYNAYINNLRINHFVRLYREAIDTRHPITARQLANNSGYRSYSTFSLAFKQRMGQSVKAWMRHTAK